MTCDRESEILRSVSAGQWPERCDDELRAHAASCAGCTDLAEVASALAAERDAAIRHAHVPASGAVWWRAQMRARQDAARAAGRAMSLMQAAAIAIAVIGVVVIIGANGGLAGLSGAVSGVHWSLALILALATPLLLAPVAVYFAVTED